MPNIKNKINVVYSEKKFFSKEINKIVEQQESKSLSLVCFNPSVLCT